MRERDAGGVLVVISLLRGGGAERVAATLANAWAQQGQNVRILVLRDLDGSEYPLDSRVRVNALNLIGEKNPWWHLGVVSRIRTLGRSIQATNADVVVSFEEKLNCAVLLACWGLPVPVVCTEHVVPDDRSLGLFWRMARRLTYPRATALVAPTHFIASILESKGHRCLRLPYPASFTEVGMGAEFEQRQKVVAAAGRLHSVKGFDILLKAFSQFRANNPDWRLELAGEGPERGYLERLVVELGLVDSVSLVGRVTDVPAFFSRARMAVISSRSEAFPMVMLEAMSVGTPLVAINSTPSIQELGQDAVEWAKSGSPESLATAMAGVAASDELAQRLSRAGTEIASAYLPANVVDSWNRLLEELQVGKNES